MLLRALTLSSLVVSAVACGSSEATPTSSSATSTGAGGQGAASTGVGAAGGSTSSSTGTGGAGGDPVTPPAVLLFTKTAGFAHSSIPDAVAALESTGATRGWTVTTTDDAATFTTTGLADIDVVVVLMTTGDALDRGQQAALETFVQSGRGWVGVHSASDTEYDWPWYGGLVGAYFAGHPSPQQANVVVEVTDHPATAHLPATWTRFDEWYSFDDNPRDDVLVLMALDESTYDPGGLAMGDHPIAWSHAYDGGRAFYTAGGHTSESYEEPDFIAHLVGGIEWAAGAL